MALRLAHILNAEIVSADSVQIYRGLNIGTAKPSPDQQAEIQHHLIDVINPDQQFSAADFAAAADAAIEDIFNRGKQPIIVGGTGLYIRALINGLVDSPSGSAQIRQLLLDDAKINGNEAMLEKLREVDPELASSLHPNNLVRIIRALEVYQLTGIPLSVYQKRHAFAHKRYDTLQIGIKVDRTVLYERIEKRVDQMMEEGLLSEINNLLTSGYSPELKSMRSIGYKEIVSHLSDEITLEEASRLIKLNTRHYAKRQLTWFKANSDILWFEYPEKFDTMSQIAIEFIK